MLKDFIDAYFPNAVDLRPHGITAYAFNRFDALSVLLHYRGEAKLIKTVRIIDMDDSPRISLDSWRFDPNYDLSRSENVDLAYAQARDFIGDYDSLPGQICLFLIDTWR